MPAFLVFKHGTFVTKKEQMLALSSMTPRELGGVEKCTVNHALTLRLLMSYIYGAPSKARNANVVYIWTYVWQR